MSEPQFMITSPEMADYLNKALTMLRAGQSIEGFAEEHKRWWKAQQEAERRRNSGEVGAVLPFFSGEPITEDNDG